MVKLRQHEIDLQKQIYQLESFEENVSDIPHRVGIIMKNSLVLMGVQFIQLTNTAIKLSGNIFRINIECKLQADSSSINKPDYIWWDK